ncbi:MAG: alpha/beta hydrolase, partial [Erysipelotrichaceae bacterium]|nr:alpha/beta hydrolase [Erysipelotrichaceae bacterium]
YDPVDWDHYDIMANRNGIGLPGEDYTSDKVHLSAHAVKVKDHMVNVNIFQKKDLKKPAPVFYYLHGGNWMGSSVAWKASQCTYMAEHSDIMVVAVDYRLCPENPYPAGLDDCIGVKEWMVANAERLGIDPERICVGGDSAGGNLTAALCLKSPQNVWRAIYIYAAFDLLMAKDTPYHWDYSMYPMCPEQKEVIMNRLNRFKRMMGVTQALYVQDGTPITDPLVSPMFAEDVSGLPKCLFIQAEFDYFKICMDVFGQRLEQAGVEVEEVLYEGMDHGFFDRFGLMEQCRDSLDEMIRFMEQ